MSRAMTFSTSSLMSCLPSNSLLMSLVIILITTITPINSTAGYRQTSHNRCYSCMSEMYEGFLDKGMDRYFNRPRNFSRQCDGEMDVTNMHTVPCRTICLTIQQDLVVMGQPTGHRLYMRGCALTIARRGLNNHTLSMFDRYDICR
ncbi:CBN-HOT-3 protein [Caenorhabditis brenneri]|uniref:CBN-HOT-3 protein n=1 Tax=Caenorhabditis brenneri TaxID=135651 RepID=G0MZ74_CAEBE|nr:CBN-HOT-3 protein [Caenorhabditis brenneri]